MKNIVTVAPQYFVSLQGVSKNDGRVPNKRSDVGASIPTPR